MSTSLENVEQLPKSLVGTGLHKLDTMEAILVLECFADRTNSKNYSQKRTYSMLNNASKAFPPLWGRWLRMLFRRRMRGAFDFCFSGLATVKLQNQGQEHPSSVCGKIVRSHLLGVTTSRFAQIRKPLIWLSGRPQRGEGFKSIFIYCKFAFDCGFLNVFSLQNIQEQE